MLKGKLDFNKAHVIGAGGITTTEFVSTYLDTVLATSGGMVDISLGINDTITANGVTVQQSLDSVDTIISAIHGAGKILSWRNLWPLSGQTQNSGHAEALRDYLSSLHDPVNGINIFNSWDAIASAPGGSTPKANALKDGIHFATLGAMSVGRAEAAILAPVLPDFDPMTGLTWLNSSDMPGTGGSVAGTQVSGQAPTGFSVNQAALSAGSLVCSVVDVGGVNKLKLVATNLGNGASAGTFDVRGPSNAITGFTAGVDHVDSLVHIEIEAGHNGLGRVAAGNRRNGGQFLPTPSDIGFDATWAGSTTDYELDREALDIYLRPPPISGPPPRPNFTCSGSKWV